MTTIKNYKNMNNEKYSSAKTWYSSEFERFQNSLNGEKSSASNRLRIAAFDKFKTLNFPTKKSEEWRHTNIAPILQNNFNPVTCNDLVYEDIDIKEFVFDGFECHLLVFVNGLFSEKLSNYDKSNNNIFIGKLSDYLNKYPEKLDKYFNVNLNNQTIFGVMNSAYLIDGTIVYLKENAILDKPIQVLYLNGVGKENILLQPKNLIVAEDNSQAKIIFNFKGINDSKYFTNSTTQIFVGKNSILDVYKIENESKNAFHIEQTMVQQKRDSVFTHFSLNLGASIARNDLSTKLNGENIESNFYGLFLTNGTRHVDNHTFVDHAKPNCYSNELYKGILDDESHGVFRGKIMVRQDAQQTNAYQSNKNILLSDNAAVDTKPQLEIYADDVKCSHGATIGALDKEAYFYIRSRGIPDNLAQSMLIKAFAEDVVESLKIEELKQQINHLVFEQLHREDI